MKSLDRYVKDDIILNKNIILFNRNVLKKVVNQCSKEKYVKAVEKMVFS